MDFQEILPILFLLTKGKKKKRFPLEKNLLDQNWDIHPQETVHFYLFGESAFHDKDRLLMQRFFNSDPEIRLLKDSALEFLTRYLLLMPAAVKQMGVSEPTWRSLILFITVGGYGEKEFSQWWLGWRWSLIALRYSPTRAFLITPLHLQPKGQKHKDMGASSSKIMMSVNISVLSANSRSLAPEPYTHLYLKYVSRFFRRLTFTT